MIRDRDKSKEDLIGELSEVRRQIAVMKRSEARLMRAEEALRESEERYRVAIEHSNDGVAIVRGDQHIFVNRRFLDMFGYDDPEEVLGTHIFVSVHPEDRERVIAVNRGRQLGESVPSRYEFKGIRRDGGEIYVEVSATKITYKGAPATLAYLRDITERKKAEEEIRQAHKMQAIGTLAGGIAHDFNNILTAIIGFSERALKSIGEEDGSKARRSMELVKQAGVRGRDLVRQILTFSRKTEQKAEPVHLIHLVEETAKLLRAALPAGIRIETRTNGTGDEIHADPSQIQQVILNLSTNAAHAMGAGGGLVEITLSNVVLDRGVSMPEADMVPGRYVVLTVRDTGTGMSEEVKQRIFDPFFTTKPAGEGTGMGLSVVYGIVKSLKGAISVSSEPGKGSIFTVYFPQTDGQTTDGEEPAEERRSGRERILFVDDEDLLVEMTRDLLEGLGYEVRAATDAEDALKWFAEDPEQFDLVILDQAMPRLSGTDLAKELVRLRPGIPVVLCTGYTQSISEEEARAIGIREVVMKPLTKAETAGMVRRVLSASSKK